MDVAFILGLLQESLFLIAVFIFFLLFGMIRGKQAIINLILSLYLALLLTLKFPYFSYLTKGTDPKSDAIIMILIFAIFTVFVSILFARLMPREEYDTAFQGFGKKTAYALLATILVMIYSYHALPVTDLITPGSPIQSLFGPAEHFFWWLLLPLVGLFVL